MAGDRYVGFLNLAFENFTDYVPDAEVTNDLNSAYTRMQSIGQTYAVVGNHDCSPVNSFPPAAVDTTITSQWAYDTLSSDWSTCRCLRELRYQFWTLSSPEIISLDKSPFKRLLTHFFT